MPVKHEILADGVEIFLGDCKTILPTLGKVDAVVTDPPYGINLATKTRQTKKDEIYSGGAYRTNFCRIEGDNKEFDPRPFLNLPCILWGANNYPTHLHKSNGWLCWHKDGGEKKFHMSQCELAFTNINGSTKHLSHMWHGFKRDSEIGEKVLHPTQKPIEVMKWCVRQLPSDAVIVLDPFMGSGTTGVACVKLGRRFIGIEINETYYNIAKRRIQAALDSPDLFIEQPKPKQENLTLGL